VNPKKAAKEPVNETDRVDAFMAALTHPFKAEVEALRAIVKRAEPKLGERVKWNAPSFFYKKDMAAFNLHAKDRVQLVFVFHDGRMIEDRRGLLEGDYKDRRLVSFADAKDVEAKKSALAKVVKAWVELMEK
jgi:hypothetical protein